MYFYLIYNFVNFQKAGKVFKNYIRLTMPNDYLLSTPYAIEFYLNKGNDSTLLTLQRRDLRSSNFIQTETGLEGGITALFERNDLSDTSFIVRTLNGFADRDKSKITRFAVYEDNLKGYIYNTELNKVLYFISLQDFIKESGIIFATTDNPLLVFDLGDLIARSNGVCGVLDEVIDSVDNDNQYRGYFEDCTPRYLEIATEGDYWWCQVHGSNAANKILENLFFVEGIYTYHFNISFVVNHVSLLISNPSLYNTTDPDEKIQQFRSYWNSNHANIHRDVAILYTGKAYASTVIGNAYPNSLCNQSLAYATMQNHSKNILICAHELGHVFGSKHDEDYASSTCSGSDKPIMCSYAVATGPNYYFSPYTRDVILTSINNHAGCLNDYANGNHLSKIHKTWSNFRNPQWVASWYVNYGDVKLAGNFDGENEGDEEIFFASPDRNWVGIMDFSCDEGTDWYHLWGNGGNRVFGTWYRNYNDRYLAGDFDGDGKDEVVSISGSNQWFAIQEYAPSSWSWTHKYGNGGAGKIAYWYLGSQDRYRVADFDGDGKDELLCVNPNGWSQLIKFNWSAGGYYVPQTIWSNEGNGWVGGVQISNTDQWLSGKYTQLAKDELFTISGTWVSTQKFNGSGWNWVWSQYGASHFAYMYILPLNSEQKQLTGNFDSDLRDEFVNINKTWAGTADYDGSTFVQNYNNGGTQLLSDWNLNADNQYLFIKAAPTAEKQILGFQYNYNCNGFWFWQTCGYNTKIASMYKGNSTAYNFRPGNNEEGNDLAKANGLKVYPNPATNTINIDFAGEYENATCTITDAIGKMVKSEQITPASPRINLGGLMRGVYVLKVQFGNKNSFTTKLVINE
ncbi:MAG: M12 family metallo-peptidase [Edaphocola sp.]